MKRLIVNADDLAFTRGVNRAIGECHRSGIVTSTTLMATGAEFYDAVAMAREMPGLSVGCHIVLVDGEPVLPPSQVRSLLVPGTDRFYNSFQQLAKLAFTGRLRREEVHAEALAQFRKLTAAGIRLSHFDAHKHVHILPSVLDPLLEAAVECGVPAVRNPFEPVFSMPLPSLLRVPVRYAEVLLVRAFRKNFARRIAAQGLHTTDGSLGLVATGTLDAEKLAALIERVEDGLWELVCHPGYNDAQLAGMRTRLRASRETEMQALTAESTRRALEQAGVQLTSYAEAVGGQTPAPANTAIQPNV